MVLSDQVVFYVFNQPREFSLLNDLDLVTKTSFSFFNQCCNICIKKWYYYCNRPSYITSHGKFAIYQCIIFLLINITFMLSFQVTTRAFPSWNSLRKEGLQVILHVLKENYNHHIADFRVFGCSTHINAFTKFCQIPRWWRQKDDNIMYFWELFNLKFSFKKQQPERSNSMPEQAKSWEWHI